MRKILKLLYKCILVAFPVFGLMLFAKYNFMGFAVIEAPPYLWNKDFCRTKHEKKMDTVIIGDSVANSAYMPEVLSGTTVNLSVSAGSPVEMYYVMKEYLEYQEAPQDVFISFMDWHFNLDDSFWDRCMYAHRFTVRDGWDILETGRKFKEPSIFGSYGAYLHFWEYQLYSPSKYILSMMKGVFTERLEGNKGAYEFINLHRGRDVGVGIYEGEHEKVEYTEFQVKPLFNHYYRKLIELCLSKKIKVHLIKVPLHLDAKHTEGFKTEFKKYYDELQEDYPSITVDWFSEGYEDYCFIDTVHMNNHGALKFSTKLKSRYPEAFKSDLAMDQIPCLNQNLSYENHIEDMFQWIANGPYSALLYDHLGDFERRYASEIQKNALVLKKYGEEGRKNIYILSSVAYANNFISIKEEGEDFVLYSAKEEKEKSIFPWKPFDCTGIDMIVINTFDGSIVTEKKFDYVQKSEFVLQEKKE